MLVAQDRMEVTLFRRANQWRTELLTKPEQQLTLASLEFATRVSAVYEDVKV